MTTAAAVRPANPQFAPVTILLKSDDGQPIGEITVSQTYVGPRGDGQGHFKISGSYVPKTEADRETVRLACHEVVDHYRRVAEETLQAALDRVKDIGQAVVLEAVGGERRKASNG